MFDTSLPLVDFLIRADEKTLIAVEMTLKIIFHREI